MEIVIEQLIFFSNTLLQQLVGPDYLNYYTFTKHVKKKAKLGIDVKCRN